MSRAPGRVNLIGDHTDYTGGLVFPVAIDRWTEVHGEQRGERLQLRSTAFADEVDLPLLPDDPQSVTPRWARYLAAVAAEVRPDRGFVGEIRSTVPVGAGLSSSAALELAFALALGAEGTAIELAQLCRRAEHRATGTPTGIMDQLTAALGRRGHALLVDCHELTVDPVPLPPSTDAELVVVDSGIAHELATSAYGQRVAECRAAEDRIGPLRLAGVEAWAEIDDPVVAARARHVVTENARVREFAAALRSADLAVAGELMVASHRSLSADYAVSVPAVDQLVDAIVAVPGVIGARMTGGGFGGCVVALARPGTAPRLAELGARAWVVQATDGACVA